MATLTAVPGAALVKRASCVPSAERPTKGTAAGVCSASPRMPSLTMGDVGPAMPLARSTLASTSPVCPASRSTAVPMPVACALAALTVTAGSMSNPSTASALTPSAWQAVCVPAFGGFWMHSASVDASNVYCVVTVALGALLVYAVSCTVMVGPLMPPSMLVLATVVLPSTNAPLLGLMRKFCPALLTTRTRSTVGLKSMPKRVPAPAPTGVGVTPSAPTKLPVLPMGVATPVGAEIEYSCTVPAASLKPRP